MRALVPRAPLACALTALLLLPACGESLGEASGGAASEDGEWPDTILYGVLPTDDQDRLLAIYTPLEEYMSDCLEHPFELFTGTDYTAMIEAMRTGNLHVSKFGPFSYTLAHERADAEALVTPVDESGEPTYRSVFIAMAGDGVEELADLEGEPFAFVEPTSTSGHLFPRALLLDELGLDNAEVEDFLGELVFSGGHDASVISVLNGDVTAAAISSNTWVHVERGEFDDHANIDDLTVVTETGDIPGTVEAVRGDLPADLKDGLRDCFAAAIDEPELADFFFEDTNIAGGYVTAEDSAYDVVRDTADALEMSPEELLEE